MTEILNHPNWFINIIRIRTGSDVLIRIVNLLSKEFISCHNDKINFRHIWSHRFSKISLSIVTKQNNCVWNNMSLWMLFNKQKTKVSNKIYNLVSWVISVQSIVNHSIALFLFWPPPDNKGPYILNLSKICCDNFVSFTSDIYHFY